MRRLFVAAATVALLSCVKSVEPRPLDVTVQPDKLTTVAGDSIEFLVQGQGSNVAALQIDFGDNSADQFDTPGSAQQAQARFKHPYSVAGVYDVQAKVIDVVLGEKTATTQVTIH
ncbi:MAG TPA: hypothetical protein VJ867_09240 [Gemmatimonadaceae bacterium]|nr:hypothetical protein [Gemmatimonadaceae bacterium]